MIRPRRSCRTCSSERLDRILDLGSTPLANDFLDPGEVSHYSILLPLRVNLCRDCSLVQLAETVAPETLYSRYAYVTSTSRTMDDHLSALAARLLTADGTPGRSRVLEIASNTGQFLRKFEERDCIVLGIEPAANIAAVAGDAGVPTRCEFFSATTAQRLRDEWGTADLIVGRHVFGHIDDLQDLLAGLEAVSHRETLVAFEVPYLADLWERTAYDTIYHEHLSYVSVRSLDALLQESPFLLSRVDWYPIHGGSIVFQLRYRSSCPAPHPSVAAYLARERRLGLHQPEAWNEFADRATRIRRRLPELLRDLKAEGRRIVGYGASAKGNALLNTCGVGSQELDCIIDNSPFKQGKVAPGSWLPVRPPGTLLEEQPDFALLLAWNFAHEIIEREREYQRRGGRFILPIPVQIVGALPNRGDVQA